MSIKIKKIEKSKIQIHSYLIKMRNIEGAKEKKMPAWLFRQIPRHVQQTKITTV